MKYLYSREPENSLLKNRLHFRRYFYTSHIKITDVSTGVSFLYSLSLLNIFYSTRWLSAFGIHCCISLYREWYICLPQLQICRIYNPMETKRNLHFQKRALPLLLKKSDDLQEAKPFPILDSQPTHKRDVCHKKTSAPEADHIERKHSCSKKLRQPRFHLLQESNKAYGD